jgi:hypothetical protein
MVKTVSGKEGNFFNLKKEECLSSKCEFKTQYSPPTPAPGKRYKIITRGEKHTGPSITRTKSRSRLFQLINYSDGGQLISLASVPSFIKCRYMLCVLVDILTTRII